MKENWRSRLFSGNEGGDNGESIISGLLQSWQ